MLEIKPVCEHCGKLLPNGSVEAMICTFECTFCADCVNHILQNVCPNCGGGFEKRPTRPQARLLKHPLSEKQYINPVDTDKFKEMLEKYKDVSPHLR